MVERIATFLESDIGQLVMGCAVLALICGSIR